MCLRILPLAVSLLLLAVPLAAAADGSSYVICDNGLRCFMPPCPSFAVRDLASGRQFERVHIDSRQLSNGDQRALSSGHLVLRGHVELRDRGPNKPRNLSVLVVTGVERETTPAERRFCPAE